MERGVFEAAPSIDDIRRRIVDVVTDRGVDLVGKYYDPKQGFAGALFDEYGEHDDDNFTSDDFVAASLLDVRFGPDAGRIRFRPGNTAHEQREPVLVEGEITFERGSYRIQSPRAFEELRNSTGSA